MCLLVFATYIYRFSRYLVYVQKNETRLVNIPTQKGDRKTNFDLADNIFHLWTNIQRCFELVLQKTSLWTDSKIPDKKAYKSYKEFLSANKGRNIEKCRRPQKIKQ